MITIKYDDKIIESNIITLSEICQGVMSANGIAESEKDSEYIDNLHYSANCLLYRDIPARNIIEASLDSFVNYLNLVYELDIERLDYDYLEVIEADK